MNRQIPQSLKNELLETSSLFKYTVEEMERISRNLLTDNNINDQFYRRLIIRNIFSIIETYIHITKKIIKIFLAVEESSNNSISWPELIILNEKRAFLDNKGNVKLRDEFQSFESSLRFTLNLYSQLFKLNKPNYGDKRFQKLIELSKRRNHITHPKKRFELDISKEEIIDLMSGFYWFMDLNNQIQNSFNSWLRKTLRN
ncbi:hypothetical protein [Cellulophaga lytica]|uniref:hypothetical protein n=1 Tax=Cellulophaga lytica TaxID=979 RepID=UPI0011D1C890|nr:hypothetical protein [Cellulophaga lytica]WQG78442.1 hypothetical protein SR888_05805 [Cellulophaga lytica]